MDGVPMRRGRRLLCLIVYLVASVAGALLVELLIENGYVHVQSIRSGGGNHDLFRTLNDWLYIPAALIAISVIWWNIDKRVPRWAALAGVLVTSALVIVLRHLI